MYFEFKNVYKISNIIILPPFNQSSHHLKNLQESRLLVLPIARFTECGNVQTSPEKQNYKGGSKAHNDEWGRRNVALQSSSYSQTSGDTNKSHAGMRPIAIFPCEAVASRVYAPRKGLKASQPTRNGREVYNVDAKSIPSPWLDRPTAANAIRELISPAASNGLVKIS